MRKYILFSISIFIFVMMAGCAKQPDNAETPAPQNAQTEVKQETQAKDRLILAIVPSSNPVTFYENIKPLISYLEKKTGRKIIARFEINYENIAAGLANDYDMAIMGAYSYLEAHKISGALPIVKSIRNGKPSYTSLIITHESTGVEKISDLKNNNNITYIFTDKFSTSGFLFPAAELIKAGVDFTKAKYKFVKGHDNIVKNISLKTANIGACFSGAVERYLEPAKAGEIRVIKITDEIPGDPLVISKKLSENADLRKIITDAFLEIKDSAILVPLGGGLEGYAPAKDSDYNIIRDKINIVNKYFK